MTDTLQQKIRKALDEIRPFLRKDGGDIRVVTVKNKTLVVQFLGNCMHCRVKDMTLKNGIKYVINKYVPEIEAIEEL